MDRRDFVVAAIAGLLSYGCGRCDSANAGSNARGCRRAGAGADAVTYELRASSGDETVDKSCRDVVNSLIADFGVRPGFSFYDEGTFGNAEATVKVMFPDGPDGTVLLGTTLVASVMNRPAIFDLTQPLQWRLANIHLIMAHEFTHILQFKYKWIVPWQLEPHADFMGGWFLARLERLGSKPKRSGGADEESAARTMFSMGDTAFNSPEHHGQPEFRAAMVRAGYESGQLNLVEAFNKAIRWAGVPTRPESHQ